ncbi:TetR/AcrR family transcriptional regulator [Naasia lichenicola]|uniref:TetR/AcrR family transcriptional regulator n=2 Tax=Naasia lichenicola TaxID=2565933 RepID=A0A4S4FLI5_9MICO|nr:TetR/AcrR family transcriptional regulator [Naasia lichenicola]
MVESAVVLLAQHGYQGTSFSTVLDRSKAPRGSIYHHFPDGKDQLIAAALELAGSRAVALLDSLEGSSAEEVVDAFIGMWHAVLERSGFTAGCSVLAVTVSSDSSELLSTAGGVFRSWSERLIALLQTAGVPSGRAASFATLLIAASEGAVVLSRAQRSTAPLDTVHGELRQMASAF